MIKYYRYVLLSGILCAAFLATGCAPSAMHQQQMDEVRSIAEEALRTANTADYQAHQAKTMADEALSHSNHIMKKMGMKSMMK